MLAVATWLMAALIACAVGALPDRLRRASQIPQSVSP